MLKRFREFVLRGNIVELAIAVVIGTAFVALITQFTDSFKSAVEEPTGPGEAEVTGGDPQPAARPAAELITQQGHDAGGGCLVSTGRARQAPGFHGRSGRLRYCPATHLRTPDAAVSCGQSGSPAR
ncbi:MAG: MscL family protein [Pseudonocardiaceae bacterium]